MTDYKELAARLRRKANLTEHVHVAREFRAAADAIEELAEKKTGRWIHQTKYGRIQCNQCGEVFRNAFAPKHFCPNCGADMGETE